MIDEQKQLFPFCIVWTMLPCISWFFPLIGHTGICNSEGIVFDFLGYHINKRNMAFGRPVKYVILEPSSTENYDEALRESNNWFAQQAHNLCRYCLIEAATTVTITSLMCQTGQVISLDRTGVKSSYVSKTAILKAYLPFILVLLMIVFCYLSWRHR